MKTYLLPGLGADSRMYPGPWRELLGARFLPWPSYGGERTLPALAERMVREHRIEPGAVLAGSSFGGMIAGEIARLVPSRCVVLLGSARSPAEIHPRLRRLHPWIERVPLPLTQRAARLLPSEVAHMFAGAEPAFLRAMVMAIFAWAGLADLPCPIRRIHGRRDHIIPAPPDADLLLDVRHLVAMTRPAECVAYLRTAVLDKYS